jgi:hypothetical protein
MGTGEAVERFRRDATRDDMTVRIRTGRPGLPIEQTELAQKRAGAQKREHGIRVNLVVLDFDPNLALIENETGVRDRSHPENAIPRC